MCTQEKVTPIPQLEIQVITLRQEETLLLQDITVAIHQQEVLLQGVQQTEAALEVRLLQEEIN
jgi:hypothetical protein